MSKKSISQLVNLDIPDEEQMDIINKPIRKNNIQTKLTTPVLLRKNK